MVELRMVDLGSATKQRYLVREVHAFWSAAAQQIRWKGFEDETYGTWHEAQLSFASRKASMVDAGFSHTTALN